MDGWIGSAAMDKFGNIARGYSITNDENINEVIPGIRYTGHRFDDPSGLMAQGEIHGIGFDDDNSINNPIRTFQLYGSQSWGISDFNDYQNAAPDWKHYRIPVGQFYTGAMLYLTFTNDQDAAPQDGESFFSNVRVVEE